MTKEEKADYDRAYRARNKEKIKLAKQEYSKSEAGRQMQKRAREKKKEYHNEYCRKPEQREKERVRRHIRLGKTKLKFCIDCKLEKPIIEFEFSQIFEDNRYYLCKECEKKSRLKTGLKTKGVIQAMTTRCDYRLSRHDIARHPYLIEANKYLIALKKLTL